MQNQKVNMSPVTAGVTGFILGVVGTAVVVLSDKNTRTQVSQRANNMKDSLEKWSKDTLHDLQETGETIKKNKAAKIDEAKMTAEDEEKEMKM